MNRISINRAVVLAGASGALALLAAVVVLTTVVTSSSRGQDPTAQVIANGGARQWVALDAPVDLQFAPRVPRGLNLGGQVVVVNASNAVNPVTITYTTPKKVSSFCSGNLAPGGKRVCRAPSVYTDNAFDGGYIQVRATHPVLMGGARDVPALQYEELKRRGETYEYSGPRTPDPARGVGIIEHVPYDWQQGCPPVANSGCTGSPTPPPSVQR